MANQTVILSVMAVMMAVILALLVFLLMRYNALWHRYDLFMRGKDCETLEDNLVELYHQLSLMKKEDLANKDLLVLMRRNVSNSMAKTALVKYNAFPGMGGESSFALTMLNSEDNGYILNAIHSRESCYIYAHEVRKGQAVDKITEQEQESLDQALAVNLDRKRIMVEEVEEL